MFPLAFATCAEINHELDPDAQIITLFTVTLSSTVKSFLKEPVMMRQNYKLIAFYKPKDVQIYHTIIFLSYFRIIQCMKGLSPTDIIYNKMS